MGSKDLILDFGMIQGIRMITGKFSVGSVVRGVYSSWVNISKEISAVT